MKRKYLNILAEIEYEAPNNNLGRFEGNLTWKGKTYPLKNDNVLLRGTRLRNTPWAFGSRLIFSKKRKPFCSINHCSCLLCWTGYEVNA